MGIGGHILGPKKLKRLSMLTGLPLDRAYIRNQYAEGVVRKDGKCTHFEIDLLTGEVESISNPGHWSTCQTYLKNILAKPQDIVSNSP